MNSYMYKQIDSIKKTFLFRLFSLANKIEYMYLDQDIIACDKQIHMFNFAHNKETNMPI